MLCGNASLLHRCGDASPARAALEGARAIALALGAGPDTELGRTLARTRLQVT